MRKLSLALLLLALTACGGGTPATGSDSTGATSSAVASAEAVPSAVASPMAVPSENATSIGTIGGNMGGGEAGGAIEQQALQTLQTQFGVNTAAFTLQGKEQTEWSDGSLGCPDPAAMYMQVITPGYKLTYTDGARTYELHTNDSGSQVVWCENGKPRQP